MPLVGSSAYGTVGSLTTLIRSLLNDAPGNVFSDSVLLPYCNSAYRTVQRKISNAGGAEFITDNVLLVVPALTALQQSVQTQIVINDATTPPNQLPQNLLTPLKIWERPNLSQQDYVEMVDLTEHGGLPSRQAGATLNCWEWRTDGIYFIGATQDTQIRLRYNSAFFDLVGPNDYLNIRGSQEAVAFGAAGLAGGARGSAFVEKMDQMAEDAIEDLIVENTRRQQNTGVRRRSYRSRCGTRRGFGWGGW